MENFTDLQSAADYFAAQSGATTTESAAALGGIFGALIGIISTMALVLLVVYILLIVAQWRIFTKAGEKGWKSLIPIYNTYINFKIIGMSFWKWFGCIFVLSLVANIGQSMNNTALMIIGCIAYIVAIIAMNVIYARNTGRAFGKGTGFKVGLFLLPTIFLLILGLGASEYQGVPEE